MLEFSYGTRGIELSDKHKCYSNTLQMHAIVIPSDTSHELHKHFDLWLSSAFESGK